MHQLVVMSGEGGGSNVWEQLQTAEMLSRGIADPSLQGLTPEERAEHSNQAGLFLSVISHESPPCLDVGTDNLQLGDNRKAGAIWHATG